MRKRFPRVWFPKWGAASSFGLLLDALADLPDAWENVKAAFPMGTTILYYITLLGAIYFGGLLFWWSIPSSVKWVKYRLNDGPNLDRFRGLEDDIRACKNGLSRYYSVRRRPTGVSPLRRAPETSARFVDIEWLFAQLISLNITPPDHTLYSDRTPRGEQFWVAYLGALERYAGRGYLRGARLRDLSKSIWETSTVEEEANPTDSG